MRKSGSTVPPTHRLPPARNLGSAIDAAPTLAALLASHRRAQACMAAVARCLPLPLRMSVRPGPIDEGCWTLLVDNGSIAAKLRQSLPTLLTAAQAHDAGVREIKVKIAPRETPPPAPAPPASPAWPRRPTNPYSPK